MKIYITLALCMFYINIHAQLSSTLPQNKLLVNNPANTGRFNKDIFASITNKVKKLGYESNIESKLVNVSSKILKFGNNKKDVLSLGFETNMENAKINGILNNQYLASLSYNKSLNEDGTSHIIIGLGFHYNQKRISPPYYITGTQMLEWLSAGYDLQYLYAQNTRHVKYADFNIGSFFQGAINDNHLYTIGFSINNINARTYTYYNGIYKVNRNYNLQTSYQTQLSPTSSLNSAVFLQLENNKKEILVAGVNYNFLLTKFIEMPIGLWVKQNGNTNFIAPTFGIKYGKLTFILANDFTFSKKQSTIGGGYEINIKYNFGRNLENILENRFINF